MKLDSNPVLSVSADVKIQLTAFRKKKKDLRQMHLEQPGGNQQPSLGIFRCVFTQLSLQLHMSPASPNDTETGSTPCRVNTQAAGPVPLRAS